MAYRRPSQPSASPANANPYSQPYSNTAASHPPSLSGPMQDEASNKRHLPGDSAVPPPPADQFINDQDAADSAAEDDDDEDKPKDKKAGRRKIKIEFIQDKSRRHITFSKRKAGIMKKAYELSTLTGTQVLLLVVSETGLVYTFTTAKLQPLVTQPEGKNLIQACLNAPHGTLPSAMPVGPPLGRSSNTPMGVPAHHSNVPGGLAIGGDKPEESAEPDDEGSEQRGTKRRRRASTAQSNRPARSNSSAGANPPASPHSPAQALPAALSIPAHAHAGQGAHQPQIGLGPSPTTASPVQQPTSPHYTHASPTTQYHPTHGAARDMYAQQQGLMAPPQGPPGGYAAFGQPPQAQQQQQQPPHWSHQPGGVQGGYRP